MSLGDLVRAKSFIFEITTPVELTAKTLKIAAGVFYQDEAGADAYASAAVELKVVNPDQIPEVEPDADVVNRVAGMIAAQATGDSLKLCTTTAVTTPPSREFRVFQAMIDRAAEAYGDGAALSAGVADLKDRLAMMSAEMDAGLMDRRTVKQTYMQSA